MRLLTFTSSGELSLARFVDENIPPYAVLSHTWGPEDEELTLKDIEEDAGNGKSGSTGYNKIQFCGKQATRHGLSYFWVDTCCIDKSSSAELSEAINSMFKWYQQAARCFAYPSDVSTGGCDINQPSFEPAFRESRWFTRGWTLQELIAPSSVEFFSREGELLGDKTSLERQIHEVTGIPVKAFQGSFLSQFTVEERISWTAKRTTTRKEDEAYCLLGIFHVFLPLIYGEGKENAFIRLQEAIDKPLKTENLLSHLPYAVDAPFNTYSRQHDPTCLPETRVDLLREIYAWANRKDGHFIYWLNGLAGTGKSTIARTVARKYFENGQLGASFFFSRGGGDVGKASKFFTTIAVQLARTSQSLQRHICGVLKKNADIATQSLGDQWRQAILGPLSKLSGDSHPPNYILVIDALDECDNDEDIGTILKLLAEAQTLQTVRLRVLLTSRPETPVRHGFYQLPETKYQDLILHHISSSIVDRDIKIFLKYNLGLIGQKKRSLGGSWPGEETLERLVHAASGLFIWAATACRFIQEVDNVFLIRKRLATILQVGSSIAEQQPEESLNEIYTTVLRHSIRVQCSDTEKEELLSILRNILGAIVTLLSPLSVHSLSRLLGFQSEEVDDCLGDLHAILDIPRNHTRLLRLHHPSFRDFLLNRNRCIDSNFWVDENQANETLAVRCIQLMSTSLKEDICGVTIPGTFVTDIKSCQVEQCLPLEVQYACLHWVKHLRHSDAQLQDHDHVHQFLQKHLLHWLEALSWMQKISDGILEIISLESITSVASCPGLHGFIHDVKRFVLHNRAGIEHAPLQVYHSALLFSPVTSIVRREFNSNMPRWVKRGPEVEANWSATLQVLEGYSEYLYAVAFSPNGKQLASGSEEGTVLIWDPVTGATMQVLDGHSDPVYTVAFSSDGKQLASGSRDKTVRIWDSATGATPQTLEGHSDTVSTVAFSSDGKQLASGSHDRTVRIWNPATGAILETLKGHSGSVHAVTFSPDSKHLASGSFDGTVRIWDVATGVTLQTLEGYLIPINAVAFSPDGKLLASGSDDMTVRIWDVTTKATMHTLEGHSSEVIAVAFSPDGKRLASGSFDETVCIWDTATGATMQTIKGHSSLVHAVTFSPDGKQLASCSDDGTVRIWDTATGATPQIPESDSGSINTVAFSPDGQQLASGSCDGTVRIWDVTVGSTLQTLEGHLIPVNDVAFSPNGKLLASGSDDMTVRIWDAATEATLQILEGHSSEVIAVVFSPDGKRLASGSFDETARIWDAATGAEMQTLKGHSNLVHAVIFSPNGKQLASGSFGTIRIWDVATGTTLQTLGGHSSWVEAVAFSPDGKQLVSGSNDTTVRIWDLTTGATLQTLEAGTVITRLSYSSDGSILTNRGRLDALPLHDNPALSSVPSPLPSPLLSQPVALRPNIFLHNAWIVHRGKRMLWLPPDYRSSCSTVYENIVCFGRPSGRVSIFEFSFSSWKRKRARSSSLPTPFPEAA